MGGLALLDRARAAGLAVEARGDRLVIRGPRSAEPLVRALGELKSEILTILSRTRSIPSGPMFGHRHQPQSIISTDEGDPTGRPTIEPGTWRREMAGWPEARREVWEERAAIMEYDGGLSRDEAEHRAYFDVSNASRSA